MALPFHFAENTLRAFGQFGPNILDGQLLIPLFPRLEAFQELLLVCVEGFALLQILRAVGVLEQVLLPLLFRRGVGGLTRAAKLESQIGYREPAPARLFGALFDEP